MPLGFKLARTLYERWRLLAPVQRERIAALAEEAKERALELRGVADRASAERDLHRVNETLAAALVETAEGDPEVSEIEVRRLREDLRRELDRLASADVTASRGARPETGTRPPGAAG
jgi:hypothetical protein